MPPLDSAASIPSRPDAPPRLALRTSLAQVGARSWAIPGRTAAPSPRVVGGAMWSVRWHCGIELAPLDQPPIRFRASALSRNSRHPIASQMEDPLPRYYRCPAPYVRIATAKPVSAVDDFRSGSQPAGFGRHSGRGPSRDAEGDLTDTIDDVAIDLRK